MFFCLGILDAVEVFFQGYRQKYILSVNVTDEIELIARELNWYINGILTKTNSSDNVLTNGNKTLMTTVGSLGVYEVRYDGLLALPHNHECERMLLSGMRHYPMFKPARFLVNTTGIELYSSHILNIRIFIFMYSYLKPIYNSDQLPTRMRYYLPFRNK